MARSRLWVWLVLLLWGWLFAPLASAAPTVLSISSELSPVQVGQFFYLSVTYDSDMDTSVNPVFTFPTPGEAPGPFLVPANAGWLDARTFHQIYEAEYVTVYTSTVDVAVDGAQDTQGVAQVPGFQADVFDITPYVIFIPPPARHWHERNHRRPIRGACRLWPCHHGRRHWKDRRVHDSV